MKGAARPAGVRWAVSVVSPVGAAWVEVEAATWLEAGAQAARDCRAEGIPWQVMSVEAMGEEESIGDYTRRFTSEGRGPGILKAMNIRLGPSR